MPTVFISYNRHSQAVARNLVIDIQALGYVVWFDQELSGGQSWWDQILSIIRGCDVFVFVLDPEGLNSIPCHREFGYANDLGKPILPVLVADGVSTNLLPPELSRLQFIDYRKQDRTSAFSLARALSAIPPSKPLPDPLPPPPEVPVSYLGSVTRKLEVASALTYEEQSALLVDLRRSFRDPKEAEDTRAVLTRLRSRRDLYAAIAEEIDELLKGTKLSLPPEPVPVPMPIPKPIPIPPKPVPIPAPVNPSKIWLGAFLGFIVGALMGMLALKVGGFAGHGDWLTAPAFAGGIGAIAGAFIGMDRRVLFFAVAGFVVGCVLWNFDSTFERRVFARGIMFGGGPGAILGAIAGVVARKKLQWKPR